MTVINDLHQHAYEEILKRPDLCEQYYDILVTRGLKVAPLPETHQERVEAIEKMMRELERREAH